MRQPLLLGYFIALTMINGPAAAVEKSLGERFPAITAELASQRKISFSDFNLGQVWLLARLPKEFRDPFCSRPEEQLDENGRQFEAWRKLYFTRRIRFSGDEGVIEFLADAIARNIFSNKPVEQMSKLAQNWYNRVLESTESGYIFPICYNAKWFVVNEFIGSINCELFELPRERAKKIFNRFSKKSNFTVFEEGLVSSGALTISEIDELKAIRSATADFEAGSFLKDTRGGWAGDFAISALPGRGSGTSCGTEGRTYYHFLKELEKLNILKDFRTTGFVIRDGHMATGLELGRNGNRLVLDSWQEPGGTPAHLTYESDWQKGLDDQDLVSPQQ